MDVDGPIGDLFLCAGEPSGDNHGARVARELSLRGERSMFGLGGGLMESEGVELLARVDGLAAVGLRGVARSMSSWLGIWALARRELSKRPPRAAILIDSPELNMPLARVLKEGGARVLQYVGPQVWAWRASRLDLLRRRTDHVALVLPFEKPLYDRAGVQATCVGHPIVDEPKALPREVVRRRLHVGEGTPVVALLPGSRRSEVEALAGPLIEAGLRLLKLGACPVFAPAAQAANGEVLSRARSVGCAFLPADLRARDLLGASDAAIVASGTATLEATLEGVPMVVTYRLGRLSWALARAVVRVRNVALPNLIAGREIVPEMLQEKATGELMARAVEGLLGTVQGDVQRRELFEVRAKLGIPGVAGRVADLVIELAEIR